jgi:hypothetical protein
VNPKGGVICHRLGLSGTSSHITRRRRVVAR